MSQSIDIVPAENAHSPGFLPTFPREQPQYILLAALVSLGVFCLLTLWTKV